MASNGYPESYSVDKQITGLDSDISENTMIFHAGTKLNKKEQIVSSGGRVLAVSSYGKHLIDAIALSYKAAKKIKFDGVVYRKDIGKDLLSKY